MNRASSARLLTYLAVLAFGASSTAEAQEADRLVEPPPDAESDLAPQWVPWLRPNAQMQMWLTAFDQDENPQADAGGYGDPEADVGFQLARARFGFDGGWKWVSFRLRFGTISRYDALVDPPPEVNIVDAWARLKFKSIGGRTTITLGQHQIPFSRENNMSSNDLVFQEIGVNTAWLSPGRDLGASIRHDWKHLGAAVGVYNGGGNLLTGDNDAGVLFAARLEGYVGGDSYRTNATTDAFGIGASYVYNERVSDVTQRVGVDALGRIKGFSIFVEGQMNFVDPADEPTVLPPGVPEVTQRWGGLVQLSYYARTPVGDVEPAVRFAYLDDARHLKDNGDVGILHAGVNWREPVPFMDFGATYIHRVEFQGARKDNDSVRVIAGLKYPSRRYTPINLVEVFRAIGQDPTKTHTEKGRPGGKKKKKGKTEE